MFFVNLVAKLVTILHSGKEPKHIAAGFALGSIIGLTPGMTLQNILVFCLVFLLNVNIPAALFGVALFSAFAFLLDPLFHEIGYYLLTQIEALVPFWTTLYNMPIAPLTRFYNTVVIGSLVISLLTFLPIYFGFKRFVLCYRAHWAEKVEKWHVMKVIKGSNLIQNINKIRFQ